MDESANFDGFPISAIVLTLIIGIPGLVLGVFFIILPLPLCNALGIIGLLIGVVFTTLAALRMRRRWLVADADGVSYFDGGKWAWTIPWGEITAIGSYKELSYRWYILLRGAWTTDLGIYFRTSLGVWKIDNWSGFNRKVLRRIFEYLAFQLAGMGANIEDGLGWAPMPAPDHMHSLPAPEPVEAVETLQMEQTDGYPFPPIHTSDTPGSVAGQSSAVGQQYTSRQGGLIKDLYAHGTMTPSSADMSQFEGRWLEATRVDSRVIICLSLIMLAIPLSLLAVAMFDTYFLVMVLLSAVFVLPLAGILLAAGLYDRRRRVQAIYFSSDCLAVSQPAGETVLGWDQVSRLRWDNSSGQLDIRSGRSRWFGQFSHEVATALCWKYTRMTGRAAEVWSSGIQGPTAR